ncbi:hypothetical protein Tco_1373763, partial [Tanacetum coccineum]
REAMALLGREPKPKVEAPLTHHVPEELEPSKTEIGAWYFLSRSNALTISLSSATSDETTGGEELVLTFTTTALLRD